jgi:hypothetical protein
MSTRNQTSFWTRLGGFWIGKNVLELKLQGFKMWRKKKDYSKVSFSKSF